jgi:hypothetical protein
MGRRVTIRKFTKSNSFSRKIIKRNIMYLNNISLPDIFDIADAPDTERGSQVLANIVIAGVSMQIMAQLALSAQPENAEYVDKLPSYKDIKKKFITSQYGRTLASATGFATAFPYLMQDPVMQGDDTAVKIVQLIMDSVDCPSPNVKRIKPTISEWENYAKGEAGSAFGQMISCPSTNLKTINIDGSLIKNSSLEDAVKSLGISSQILEKHNISTLSIIREMRSIFLLSSAGIPISKLEYNEPKTINSRIQSQILGDELIRTGTINLALSKSFKPDRSITQTLVERYLSKYELMAYNFAIKSGDKNILKKYTELVVNRSSSPKS